MQVPKKFTLPAWRLSGRQILALVAALIVIYIVYGVLVPSVITITATRSITLSPNQTQFIRIYNGSTTALELRASSVSGASFYITHVPALYGSVVSFSLSPVSSLNVSTDGSQTADINIRLLTESNSSATVEITPLILALSIKPSPSVTLLNPSSLSSIGSGSGGLGLTVSTTSVLSTSTTTVAQNSTQLLFQQALTLMNKTGTGILMKGYRTLYEKDAGCTSGVYNSTYATYYSKHPPAPVDFANISAHTPTDITINESTLQAKNNVLITYSTISPSPDTTGQAVLAIINTSSSNFLSSLTYTGLYTGLNYSTLNSSYSFQSKILNDCGAYITPP